MAEPSSKRRRTEIACSVPRLRAVSHVCSDVVLVDGGSVTIGRDESLGDDYRLNANLKHVSGLHLRVDVENGSIAATDLSSNGTYVNSKRLEKGVRTQLNDGDLLSLGYASLEKAKDQNKWVSWTLQLEAAEPARPSAEGGCTQVLDDAEDPEPSAPAPASSPAAPAPPAAGPSDGASRALNASMMEELTCGICHGHFYKPISFIPCLHSFCRGCAAEWLQRSKNCPYRCPDLVTEVRPNAKLTSLTDAFLAANPGAKKSADELKEADEAGAGLADGPLDSAANAEARRRRRRRSPGMDEGSEGSGSGDSGEEEEDEPPPCPECTAPGLDGHQCGPNAAHLRCRNCVRCVPARDDVGEARAIRCAFCRAAFCNRYFPADACPAPRFLHLQPLREHAPWGPDALRLGGQLPDEIINQNSVERGVLAAWCAQKGRAPEELVRELLGSADRGEASLRVAAGRMQGLEVTFSEGAAPGAPRGGEVEANGASPACRECAAAVFRELLYEARRAIPAAELPQNIRQREDCWWGRNCRTQRRLHHAESKNHVCPQTKF
eukprot:tig00021293_g20022.t1